MKNTKRIKNKLARKVLRQIALWDRCPTEYRRDIKSQAVEIAATTIITTAAMIIMSVMFVKFC